VEAATGMKGWMGKIVRINLSSSKVAIRQTNTDDLRNFIGGRGLGAKILYDELAPATDAYSIDNRLIFCTGPLTGTRAPTSGRYCVVSKSPLTGTIFDSQSGGSFGPELKFTGYDAIIIQGRSSRPVYLWINDGEVRLVDATELWGLDTQKTTDTLIRSTDSRAKVACIGPAGEKLVRIAAIINDKHRAAGRGGLGAVMGSKKLKAVVVRGMRSVEIADKKGFDSAVEKSLRAIGKNPITDRSLPTLGTAALVNVVNELGMFPTKNFQEGYFEDAEGISGEKIAERILTGQVACWGCPIACGRATCADRKRGEGPEYETVWALGAQCGVSDLIAVTEANYVCNELGIDTISAGSTIGCAMELHERRLLREEINFGDAQAVVDLVRKIAYREGIGDQLAEGSYRLAERCGAPELSMSVKKLEMPAYDPRGAQGHALAYATSNRGGCHLRAYLIGPEVLGVPALIDRFKWQGKAQLVMLYQNLFATIDSLILCVFSSFALNPEHYAELLSSAVGVPFSGERLIEVGERIYNLERLINIREGFSRKDDSLPSRFLKSPLVQGGSRGRVVALRRMLSEYYRLRGWDRHGEPKPAKLKRLRLVTARKTLEKG